MKSITENLNLSLLEITAVLFPGSALLLLLNQINVVKQFLSGLLPNPENEWQTSLAFLGTAYFCGYVLFSLGSLLDEIIYDNFKHFFFKKETLTDSDGNPIKDKCNKEIKVRPRELHETSLFKKALKLKKQFLKGTDSLGNDINLYKWTAGYLLAQYPSLYSVVERHQAASKFFRSMVWVFFFAFCTFAFLNQMIGAIVAIFFLCMAVYLYVEQRQKAITAAYEYLIVVNSTESKS